MKRYILTILFLSLVSVCYAETYCIYNTSTKEVYSLSNQDDAVMPKDGYTKVILKDNMNNLDLIYPHNFYKYNGKTILADRNKLEEESKKESDNRKKFEEEQEIQDELRTMAKERIANKTNVK